MKQPVGKIIVLACITAALLAPVLSSWGAGYGLEQAVKSTGGLLPTTILNQSSLPEAVGSVVSGMLAFLGIIFFGIMLYAGFNWMTAMGNSEKVDKSKGMIEGALIGLIIVLLAYALTKFVFTFFETGQTDTGGFTEGSCTSGQVEGDICASDSTCIKQSNGSLACVSKCIQVGGSRCTPFDQCPTESIIASTDYDYELCADQSQVCCK